MFQQFHPAVMVAIVIALIAAVVVIYKKANKKEYFDVDIPMPEKLRTDLMYGYYSALERTFDQVKDHVNLFWYTHFSSIEQLIWIMKNTDFKIVVDLSPYLHAKESGRKGKLYVKDSAESDLRDFFARLKFEGVLHHISFMTTNDEPNLFTKSAEEHLKAIEVVKRVRAEFAELADSKLLCLYGADGNWMNIEQFDMVGVDYYDQKSQSLTIGAHAELVAALKPGQKTFLVPGPAFGHKPEPWLAYAHSNPDQVAAIIPFIWFDDPNHKDVNYTGLEAASEELRQAWINAGKSCVAK